VVGCRTEEGSVGDVKESVPVDAVGATVCTASVDVV
jgi:hypothetical protein